MRYNKEFFNKNAAKPQINWKLFEEYNNTDARLKAEMLKKLDIHVSDPAVLGVLTKSNFVIPGVTRYECQQCGECCKYARKIADLTYEPCLYLTKENTCSKHDNNYNVCKWFPFWLYTDPKYGHLLTIKPYCSGYNMGKVIDYELTVKKMLDLQTKQSIEDDGAFVIHEVLYLPEKKAWFFPSKKNIDELLQYIIKSKGPANKSVEYTKGQLHYAQQKTSGLLGSIKDPQLTISDKGIITDANEQFGALYKLDRNKIIGQTFSRLFLNTEFVESKIKLCFSKGKITALPLRLLLPDNTTLNVILNALVYRDHKDGLVHGVLASISPISSTLYKEAVSSQEYARNIIEASIDSMMTIDIDGSITDVNEACCELFGYSRTQIVNSNFSKYFSDSKEALRGVDLTYEQEKLKNYELTLISSTGESIPVSFNASVFKSIEGVTLGIIAIARDIREIKKLISEIENAKEYSRGLIESSIDMMLTIDINGIITDINEAVARNTGYSRESLIGSEFTNYFIDKDLAAKGVEMTFSKTVVRDYKLLLKTRIGKEIVVSFNASLYKNKKNEVQGIFAIARVID